MKTIKCNGKIHDVSGLNSVEIVEKLRNQGITDEEIERDLSNYSFKSAWNGNLVGLLWIILGLTFIYYIKSTWGMFHYTLRDAGDFYSLNQWILKPYTAVTLIMTGIFLLINRGYISPGVKYSLLSSSGIFLLIALFTSSITDLILGIAAIVIISIVKTQKNNSISTVKIILEEISDKIHPTAILEKISIRNWKGSSASIMFLLSAVLFTISPILDPAGSSSTYFVKSFTLFGKLLLLICISGAILSYSNVRRHIVPLTAIFISFAVFLVLSIVLTYSYDFNLLSRVMIPSGVVLLSSIAIIRKAGLIQKQSIKWSVIISVIFVSMPFIFIKAIDIHNNLSQAHLVQGDETKLNFYSKNLTSIPSSVYKNSNLKRLVLNGNKIESISGEIGNLSNLEVFAASENQITKLPPQIGKLKHLSILYINSNNLSCLPPEIGDLDNLTDLYIANNKIQSLPPEITKLSHLENLQYQWNNITTFPVEITAIISLKNLGLSYNQLTTIPSEVGNLVHLKDFNVSNNVLTSIPDKIGLLKHLTSLDLSSNKIEKLPPGIGNLDTLEHLDLSGNQLTELPKEIGQCKKLKSLNIDKNQLTTLPKEIGNLTYLEKLSCENNNLEDLPAELGNCKNLKILKINNNQIKKLPRTFKSLTILNDLMPAITN